MVMRIETNQGQELSCSVKHSTYGNEKALHTSVQKYSNQPVDVHNPIRPFILLNTTELQMREGLEGNSKIIFLILVLLAASE